jgi:hypothetical protein
MFDFGSHERCTAEEAPVNQGQNRASQEQP